jgi:CRP/FNR family transcriptional regulator, cyclic AMP receptor protein
MSSHDTSFYREILAGAVPFRGLQASALDHIIRQGMLLEARQSDVVAFENMRGGIGLYVLVEGRIGIFVPDEKQPEAPKIQLNELNRGDCFGEYSLMDGLSTSASAEALLDSRLFFLPRGEFQQIVERDASAGRTLYRNLLIYLIARLRQKDAR